MLYIILIIIGLFILKNYLYRRKKRIEAKILAEELSKKNINL